MLSTTRRPSYLLATPEEIAEQVKIVDAAVETGDLKVLVEAEYKLFRMVWKLPVNRQHRKLVRDYMWPNIREWRKVADRMHPENIRCLHITLQNAFKRLSVQ